MRVNSKSEKNRACSQLKTKIFDGKPLMSFTTIRAYTSNSSLFDVDLRGLFSSATGTSCRMYMENWLA